MSSAEDDLPRREAAWTSMSGLYLDTDVSGTLPGIARELAALPWSLAELDRIFWEEVHPALRANLAGVAGEWAGFGRTWLLERIRTGLRRPPLWRRITAGWLRGRVQAEWNEVLAQVAALRGHAAGGHVLPPGRQ